MPGSAVKEYLAVPFDDHLGPRSPASPPSQPMAASTPLPEDPDAIPLGVRLLRCMFRSPIFQRLPPRPSWLSRIVVYRISILLLTYLFYVAYHLARRPLGVVKNRLHQNCSQLAPPPAVIQDCNFKYETWCSWEPFHVSKDDSKELFSWLDFTYRFSYAVGMIFAGHIAERMDIRRFVSFGMVMSGLGAIFNGMAYFWNIHSYSFFIVAQIFGGVFQGTGWPSVVPLMGNWFGKKRLGIIFGIWNSHTSVGNILGAVIAGVWVSSQWGYSFIVPGLIIAACGVIAYFFVVVKPEDVGLPHPDHADESMNTTTLTDSTDVSLYEDANYPPNIARKDLEKNGVVVEKKAISMWQAIKIPGVIEFSLCLFFSKAVYYTFFFWLPVYIKDVAKVGNQGAADMSAIFDAGGIIGGIIAGAVSDATGGSATVCGAMFILAIPSLYCMVEFIGHGNAVLMTLLVITGLFINGPYALITTAVSTDLGTRPSLIKNTHALATVAAVIDGMGSLGSAFGPLGAGLLSKEFGWQGSFYYLIAAQIVALLCLTRLIYREIRHWMQKRHRRMSVFQDQQPHLRNGKLNKTPSRTELDSIQDEKEKPVITNGGGYASSPV